MALWNRNDQAVTVNATTTAASTTGAPLGTHALVKGGGGEAAHYGNSTGSRANTDLAMFSNTTPGSFVSKMAVGVFGVSVTETANNRTNASADQVAHAGWNVRRAGTGPLVSFSINASATALSYNNNDVITVKSPHAGGNASVSFTTNATGGSLTFTITNPGYGFDLVSIPASNVFVTNSTGGTAAGNATATHFLSTIGGRAGRVHYETLVAMGSLGANTTSSTGVSGPAATVTDATSDNVKFPGV